MQKVAVIGAGVVGSTIAATLSARGHTVTVLDAGQPGHAVSEASFAWVNANYRKRPASYRELNRRAVQTHHRWRREGKAPWFYPTGSLAVTGGTGGQESMEAAAHEDEPIEELGGSELRQRFPDLGPGVDHAYFHPTEGWVDTRHQIAHQLSTAVDAEVRTSCPVTRIVPSNNGHGVALHTAGGRIHAFHTVVITAGNGAAPLLRDLVAVPLLTTGSGTARIGMTIETEPLDTPPTTVLRSPDVSIRPTAEGGAVIADHATAANFSHEDPDLWSLPRVLLDRAAAIMPDLSPARIARVRVSERVMPPDGLPVIGRLHPGVLTVLMHSGVTLAPLVSEYIADELESRPVPELDAYRPSRF